MLARWGRFIHHHTWWTLLLSGSVLALSVFFLLRGGELKNPRSLNLEAGHASDLIDSELPKAAGGSSFDVLFVGRANLRATDPRFKDAMTLALAPLLQDSRVTKVITPFGGDPAVAATLTAEDGRSALAVVELKDPGKKSRDFYPELRNQVRSDRLEVLGFNGQADNHAFDKQLADDLQRAEAISLPLTVILLLLVFGALVAAGLPLVVGIVSIVGGIGGIYLIAGFTSVSSYAQNVVTLIGLGVSVDYSLFIVNRFREELAAGAGREEALATTMATAGRAITFSGVTVAVGLSGMLFYPGSFLPSMGLAGGVVVVVAVFYSLTLLPALLALLGPRINRLTIPISATGSRQGWHRLAMAVMRRPLVVLVPTVAFIILAGLPFAHLRMANSGIDALPSGSEVVRAHDIVKQQFPTRDQTQVAVVGNFPATPLTAERVGALYDYSRRLRRIPGVERVTSIVDLDPSLDRAAYIRLYTATPASALPPQVAEAVHQTVGKHIVVMNVFSNQVDETNGARQVVNDMRGLRNIGDGHI
ncbi:MAG TPA: MMPL family transporter, partial [Candidatus Dormibacteraeota bacterium]|nr:MMPL family transporter [Candidatus Dormibacteraeota bacterium]